jgi:hypothetical protein
LQPHKPTADLGAQTLFAAILIVPTVLGFAPTLLFLDHPLWISAVAAVALVVAIIYLIQVRSIEARPITPAEAFAMAIGGLAMSSSMGLGLMIWYGVIYSFIFYLLFNLFAALAHIFPSLSSLATPSWASEDTIDFFLAVVASVTFVPATVSVIANNLRKKMFPKTGVGNSVLFPGFPWRRYLTVAGAALIPLAILVALWLYDGLPLTWLYVGLQVYLAVVSAQVKPQKPIEGPAAVVRAVEALLKANGYQVPPRFQTHDAGLDRLISVFDLVAYGDGNGLAFQFKTGGADAPPVTWSEASPLRSATWAIYKAAEQQGISVNTIRPVMVLAGRQADHSLKAFAEAEGIHIVEMQDHKLIDDVVDGKFSDEQLRGMAQSVLRVRPARSTPTTPQKQSA